MFPWQDDHKKTIPVLEDEIRKELSQKTYEGKHPFKKGTYSFERGLTKDDREIVTDGFRKLNRLTPSKQKPEWLKFVEEMTGFFALLLWAGGILCFIGYGLRGEADNVSCPLLWLPCSCQFDECVPSLTLSTALPWNRAFRRSVHHWMLLLLTGGEIRVSNVRVF